ncbi:MAG: dephospho-CoA kinase, partial [Flavobacteriales bacterium]
MKKIGITGGIGVGKTYVSNILRKMNYAVYNSDVMAKELLENDDNLMSLIKNNFGDKIYSDYKINKSLVASLIFSNDDLLKQFNSIVHPYVFEDFKKWCKNQQSSIIFKETAILFESDAVKDLDCVICVTANKDIRIKRIISRDNKTDDEIGRIMSKQMDQQKKEELSDYVITNNGDS